MNNTLLRVIAGLLIAGATSTASAATYSWSFTSSATSVTGGGTNASNDGGFASQVREYASMKYTAGGQSVNLQAYANTGTNSTIEAAYLTYQGSSGLGVTSRSSTANPEVNSNGTTSSPDHSFDSGGATELILVTFDQALSVDQLSFGWSSNDTDFTLYAYTGSAAFNTSSFVGKTLTAMTGWTQVGVFDGGAVANNGGGTRATDNNVSSRYWLITPSGSDSKADYVKLSGIVAETKTPPPSTGVPEPTSLALLGSAFLGLLGTRHLRRKA